MGDLTKTILKTALMGLCVLALVALTVVFAGMSRQALIFLILFILLAVLGVFVGCPCAGSSNSGRAECNSGPLTGVLHTLS